MRRSLLLHCSAFAAIVASGQPQALVTGRVIDAASLQPLAGAVVEALLPDTLIATVTDDAGAFRMEGLPVGVHSVRARHSGYGPARLEDVWARAGRAEEVVIALLREARQLAPFEVSASAPGRLDLLGAHRLTVEQALRFPATFQDPVRLATTRPGVAAVNDQANHISVRGNGPSANAYMLEGAEIVCPNHLTNAGTASDLPTLSGGGVTILSAQMLGTSRLLTGGFGAAHGNALGGIMDMRLRGGNRERRGFTAQAGLLGIDLSTEGPIAFGKSSYLVNYRYSTLGLLSALGVDLGDEAITFQDLSVHASLRIGAGQLSVFGIGGTSENRHDAMADTALWEVDKDAQDILYTSRMGAAGLSFALPLGNSATWRTVAVLSESDQQRDASSLRSTGETAWRSSAALRERKTSMVMRINGRASGRLGYELGGSAMERTVQKDLLVQETVTGWLLRPYAQAEVSIGTRVRLEAGAAYAHCTANGQGLPEPRARLDVRLGERSTIALAGGQRSQLPVVQSFYVKPFPGAWDNSAIGPDRMQEVVMAGDHALRPWLRLHAEAYHQRRTHAGIGDAARWMPPINDDGSLVNTWDQPLVLDLRPDGRSRSTGVEAAVWSDLHRGRYWSVNASVFNSTYTAFDGSERDARWNRGFLVNAIMGREFTKRAAERARTWGVNIRGALAGGLRATPIDTAWSRVTGGTVHDPARSFTEQQPVYHRVDLRIYLRREHHRRTGQWSLDLQNVLNTRNEAYRYFDRRRDAVLVQYQLGLIPNLSYRIEF